MKKGIIKKAAIAILAGIMAVGNIGNIHSIRYMSNHESGVNLGFAPLTVYANVQPRPNQQAIPSSHTVLINGQPVSLQAYNIQGNNYFMLRDIAYVLNGTDAQFSVNWSATWRAPYTSIRLRSGQPYEIVGGEMTGTTASLEPRTAAPTSEQIFHHPGGTMTYDGSYFRVHPRGYLIGNNNFFMLRELGDILGFDVDWDGVTGTILVSTGEGAGLGNVASANVTTTNRSAQDTTTTIPTPTPTPNIDDASSVDTPSNNWLTALENTQSSITLPNRRLTDAERNAWIAEYHQMGGANAFEIEVVRLTNEIRAVHGVPPLATDPILMMVARFHTQTMANLDTQLGHNVGPYGGPHNTRNMGGDTWGGGALEAFGFTAATGGNGHWWAMTPQDVVDAWMDSPGHMSNILDAGFTRIGFGSHLGGQWGVFHYQIFH